MSPPTLKIEISFVESPSQSDSWTDVTAYLSNVEAVSIQRGRQHEFDTVQAGTATLLLDNDTGYFTPDNADSPYYPYIKPRKRIRISATYRGASYPLFTGYIKGWPPSRPILGMTRVRLDCLDALGGVIGNTSIPSQTLINAATTGTGIIAYDALTGNTDQLANFAPFTRISCSRAGSSFSGTYTITVNGETTSAIAVNATTATVMTAIEALPSVGPDVAYYGGTLAGVFSAGGGQIFLGQNFANVDLTGAITADFSGVSSPFAFSLTLALAAPSGPPSRMWGRTNQRTLAVSLSAAVTSSDFVKVWIRGINWAGKLIAETTAAFFTVAGNTTATFSNTFDQVFGILLDSQLSGGATRTVTVSLVNTPTTTASGDQFTAAARAGGMRAADIAVNTGVSTLQTPTLDGASAVGILQTIAQSESGLYYVDVSGVLQFRDRVTYYGGASRGTFGTVATTTLPYVNIDYSYDDVFVRNAVTIGRVGGTDQVAQDIPSIDRYGVLTYSESGTLITTDAEALSKAKAFLIAKREPNGVRIGAMKLQGEDYPDSLWPLILGAELTQKFTITNDIVDQRLSLEYITMTMTLAVWDVTWQLVPSLFDFFILDQSVLNGTDVLLY
jgi:hypothetical protein